jgi:hypothetical protein
MQHPAEIIGVGPDLLSAFQQTIDQLVGKREGEGERVRVQAAGTDAEGLMQNLIDQIADTAEAFERQPANVGLDGLRAIEGGMRVWGVLALAMDREQEGLAPVHKVEICAGEDEFRISLTVGDLSEV